jgi:hypothetical protein
MGTPTLRLKRLSMKAFRSFVDSAELELPESGVHLVNAPSGHGKSSLVEAIAFAFDYSQFPATEHQSWPWLTDEPMQVGLDFYVGSVPAEVRRGKKAALRIGDAPALTSAATIAKKLPEVLGLKPEMLKALTYRPQRQRGLFLSFTDSEKKSFLTDLLHLGHAEAEVDRTQKAITALEREVALAQARAEQARGGRSRGAAAAGDRATIPAGQSGCDRGCSEGRGRQEPNRGHRPTKCSEGCAANCRERYRCDVRWAHRGETPSARRGEGSHLRPRP